MRSQKTIEERLKSLNLELIAHQTQISKLSLHHDFDLLSLLEAEQSLLLTEMAALTWVLGGSWDEPEEAYPSCLGHRRVPDHHRVSVGV